MKTNVPSEPVSGVTVSMMGGGLKLASVVVVATSPQLPSSEASAQSSTASQRRRESMQMPVEEHLNCQ